MSGGLGQLIFQLRHPVMQDLLRLAQPAGYLRKLLERSLELATGRLFGKARDGR
jgi:hypothetical protein